jgi:hypothetical protein
MPKIVPGRLYLITTFIKSVRFTTNKLEVTPST